MKEARGIQICNLAVHILDNKSVPPQATLSDAESDVSSEINTFFASHIEKSLGDDNAKIAKFSRADGEVRRLCLETFEEKKTFIKNSKRMAELLFTPMRQTRAISPGDMVVCLYEAENIDGQFLGIFKMDLAAAFAHRISHHSGRTTVHVTPQDNILPSPRQKLQKCVFIRPPKDNEYDMVILDNQISHLTDAAGVANFFCRTFLECELWQTDREKTRLFRTLTTKWTQQRYSELEPSEADLISKAARQAILGKSISVREFTNVVIPERLRADYATYLQDHNLRDLEFSPDHQYAEQATRKKKFRADGGITISGDADQFENVVSVDLERDAQNRVTVTIKTTQWIEQTR